MFVMAFLLFLFLAFVVAMGLFIAALPALMGIVTLIVVNILSKIRRGKVAPVLWNILTVLVMIASSVVLWADMGGADVDAGASPLVVSLIYGIGSLALYAMPPRKPKKKVRTEPVESVVEETDHLVDWRREELWEDYPAPDYDAVHTYCEVAFDDSGETFYYRTRNPELKVGDAVLVPFGYNKPHRIGVIVIMEDYEGRDVPFPLEKTKFIIGKAK